MRFLLFALLTAVGFVVFALTITFSPVLPTWANYGARVGLLALFGALWWRARGDHPWSRFRPAFFAYLATVAALSLGYVLGDWGLKLFGLTTRTPVGVAVAKFWQASVIVIGILAVAKLCGEDVASLYLRKGRLALGLGIGAVGAVVCLVLSLQQATSGGFGPTRLLPLAPWILLFVASNALMEELLFRGLFVGRFEALIGRWPAIVSTALAFTLAHMQVSYTPDIIFFLLVLLGLSIAWGWLTLRTGSLWGSALFHAGADLLIILPIFKSLGAA